MTSLVRLVPRATCGIAGAFLGLALGIWIADGQPSAILFALLIAGGLGVAVWRVPLQARPEGALLVVIAFSLRLGAAAVLHAWSVSHGSQGYVTGDDQGYFDAARYFVLWLKGTPKEPFIPPAWSGLAYLFGTYVYIEVGIFLAAGA